MENILTAKANTVLTENQKWFLIVPAWRGFQSRQGAYNSIDKAEKSDGRVKVNVQGLPVDSNSVISEAQINSIKYLVDNSIQVREAILRDLLNDYPNAKGIYEDYMPDITTTEQYKDIIGLSYIHVMSAEKDGFAYTGFQFGCDWDDEHGLGIMTYKDKILAIGGADTSFNSWIAYKDNGTSEAMQLKWERDNEILRRSKSNSAEKVSHKKVWWNFWR